jgi:hypothetical protein
LQNLGLAETSDEKLRAKAGKTSWGVGGKGIATFYRSGGHCATKGVKRLQPVVLTALPGKGLVRKEAYRLT